MQRFIFCPGAIYGARGWTPVVRVSRDGKPCGSKTTEPFATREEAAAHAAKAAHRAAKAIGATFAGRAEFVVRDPADAGAVYAAVSGARPAGNPVETAAKAIAEALEPPAPAHSFVRDIIGRVVSAMFPTAREARAAQ